MSTKHFLLSPTTLPLKILTGAIARTQADDILEQDMKQGLSKTASLFNFLFDNGRTEEIEIIQQRQKP
jgi:hypothetical protein